VSPWIFLLTMLGGGIGAASRFVVDGLVMRHVHNGYPWGTSVINTSGSLILGFLTGLADSSILNSSWMFVLGVGMMGGYTTFSTAIVDTVHLLQKRSYGWALANAAGMLVAGIVAAFIGLGLGRLF